MDARKRAKILHGLVTIQQSVESALSLLRLERYLHQSDAYECCIKQLEDIQDDMAYGVKVIEEGCNGD